MSALHLAALYCHPVKSLGGFRLQEAWLSDRGLRHDRRWMLVNGEGRFLTQRELPRMACLSTAPSEDGFMVEDRRDGALLQLPWTLEDGADIMVEVWNARVRAREAPSAWSGWFSERLERQLRLVHMPEASRRRVDGRYAQGLTSFSDGFPHLIISQASLDDLNGRLSYPVGMDRFRPNLVIGGGRAFQEDGWHTVRIGGARFDLVKPCARCVMVTTDQYTGDRGQEPLRTLATYRTKGSKVLFGMNAVGDAEGMVRVGDLVTPLTAATPDA